MKISLLCLYLTTSVLLCLHVLNIEAKALGETNIRSDVIVTRGFSSRQPIATEDDDDDLNKPGWMRRQLTRFGELASRVGNNMGRHASKVAVAVDKVCEIVKTIIPVLAAVCHVGQFKFCAATEAAPQMLADAISPTELDLDQPD